MSQKRYAAEQIIGILRRAEVLVGQGKEMAEVLREIGVTGNKHLPLAQGVWRSGDGSGAAPEGAGGRKCATLGCVD